jgi:hypothetical protein
LLSGANTLVLLLPSFVLPLREEDLFDVRQAFQRIVGQMSTAHRSSLLIISPNRVLSAHDIDDILEISTLDETVFDEVLIWNASLDCDTTGDELCPLVQACDSLRDHVAILVRQHLVRANKSRAGTTLMPLSVVASSYVEGKHYSRVLGVWSPHRHIDEYNTTVKSLLAVCCHSCKTDLILCSNSRAASKSRVTGPAASFPM